MTAPVDLPPVALALAAAMVPMLTAWALWIWRWPDRDLQGGIALCLLWNATWLPAANAVAVESGAWAYRFDGPMLMGLPLPLWFGWILLWGVVGPLLPWPPLVTTGLFVIVDLIYMPLFDPVVQLGATWWTHDLGAIAVVALPGLLLARWSTERSHLSRRVVLQIALFSGLLLWAVPNLAADVSGRPLGPWPSPPWWGVVIGSLGLVALPGLTAVDELRRSGGTPWPWDSTVRLVRSGPYRFLRSPMQLSAVAVLTVIAVVGRHPPTAAAAVVALAYARIFCRMEEQELARRFGDDWITMAASLRRWLPRWRPVAGGPTAVLWVDLACELCRPVGRFIQRRAPVGLTIDDAATHRERLMRVRYERADGLALNGVAAVGAALEHLNLGWAMVGWLLRLPLLHRWWQLIGDAVGFGPRPARAGPMTEPGQ